MLVVACSQVFRPFKRVGRGFWGSRFMAVSKGGGDCADEVIGSNWPTENEDSYTAYATALLEKAAQAQKAAQAKQAEQQYAQSETSSQTLDALAKAAGMDAAKHMQSAEDFAKAAGWAKYAATAIKAAKLAMNEAAAAHEAIHAMPTISATAASKGGKGATQKAKDADLEEKQNLVADAKGSMDSALDAADRAVQADAIPTPFGGTPAIPEGSNDGTQFGGGSGLPGDAPVATAPGGGAGVPSASTGGGGEASAAPPAPALPPSVFAAPAAPPAGLGGDPASALGSSPAAASAGEGAGSGMGSGMGGMPMGGSPMGMGQMPMQPPQMPQGGGAGAGGPVGEVAKPVSDMVSKLAGKDGGAGGGVPVSEQTLDKLLAAQGGDGGAGGDQLAPSDDGSGDGKPGEGKGDHLDGDPKKGGAAGSHDQVTGVRAPTDPYSASNTNPALNNPAASHGGAPSPAAPVVTAPPVAVSAPMTELSADDNAPAAPVQHASAQVQPPTVENAGLHTHTAAAGITGPGAPAPVSPTPNPQAQGGLLGAYPSPGGMPAPTPPMGGMPMMPPMGGMGAGGGGGGSVSPVLAAVPAAIGGAVVARDSHREPQGDAPVERILALPPEHGTAENHLAGLAKVFRTRGWESERIAVGVFMDGTVLQPRLRYIVATSDGLSLIPLGIATPAGVELLSQQRVRSSFVSDWSGNDHPGRKLAALANEYSQEVGRLVYLVSTDSDAVQSPGRSGEVTEVYQTSAETTGLIRDNRATSAVAPRTEIVRRLPIREEQAQEALAAFGAAWGFHDATADDLNSSRAMLWAARWGRARSRSDDYPALLATYLYVEGLEALRAGRLDEAAYSASSMLSVEPLDA